jgi:hypothetical protein
MPTVGVNKIARALNLSTQRIQELVKVGMPGAEEFAEWDRQLPL